MILSIKRPDSRASQEVLKESAGSVLSRDSLRVPCKALSGQAESGEHRGCECCLVLHLRGRWVQLAVASVNAETSVRSQDTV